MQIGQVSELSGYSQRMIRFLEDQGLIFPKRTESNIRSFSEGDLAKILKIKRLKELGFSYQEVKDLIDQDSAVLAQKGSELLKKHHQEAQGLREKIRQLETLCLGRSTAPLLPEKVSSLGLPQRTAYRIPKFDAVVKSLKEKCPDHKSELVLWKFIEFLRMQEDDLNRNVQIAEIFRGSSQLAVLKGAEFLNAYCQLWEQQDLPLYMNVLGEFSMTEVKEFFGNYEIVIEHIVSNSSGEIVFHALIPYQALFIATELC